MQIVSKVDLVEFPLFSRGKVRDIYTVDDSTLCIITTDRMSAFDVILQEPVPYKGVVLNEITLFWMNKFKDIVANHILINDFEKFPEGLQQYGGLLRGRSVLARKAKPLPIECIVRGHLAGSGWAEYQKSGTVCGQKLPAGLKESSKLETPIFTPSTKADIGQHDENISDEQAIALLGKDLFKQVKDLSLTLFTRARDYAESRGVIIADTKFEFGHINGELVLIDEVLTPDSSRFWPMEGFAPGKSQPSFDKQYLRDWLSAQDWDKSAPAPIVPAEVLNETAAKYSEAFTILTGQKLSFE